MAAKTPHGTTTAIITSPDRALLWTENGDLLLLDTQLPKYAPLAERRPFNEKHPDALAPALVGDHLYLRSAKVLGCFVMGE